MRDIIQELFLATNSDLDISDNVIDELGTFPLILKRETDFTTTEETLETIVLRSTGILKTEGTIYAIQ